MIVLIARDLITASRIAEMASRAGKPFVRLDDPTRLPAREGVTLLLVNWDERGPEWAAQIRAWAPAQVAGPRPLLFGPHLDRAAHAEARAAGLGPVVARSALSGTIARLLHDRPA